MMILAVQRFLKARIPAQLSISTPYRDRQNKA